MTEEKEAPTLKEDLGRVFDEYEKEKEEEVEVEAEEVVEEAEPGADEESHKEAATDEIIEPLKADDAEGDEETGEADEDEGDEEEGLEPLQHWRPEDREMFKTLPEEAKEFLIDRDKRFQRSVTRGQEDVADIRKALEPVRQELVKHGVSEGDAVRRLIGAHIRLKDDPANTILELMSSYDIDIGDLTGENGEGEKTGPSDSAVKREVQELREEMRRDRETRQAGAADKFATEVEEFKVDHEFFDDVREEMTAIAWSYSNRKLPSPPLADLYEKACWQDPVIRKKMIAREGRSDSEKGKAEAKKAKRATKSRVRSTPKSAGDGKPAKKTLREDLSETYDRMNAR